MRPRRVLSITLLALAALAPTAQAQSNDASYALANGCYSLTSGGSTVAGPFRMKATDLGSYMLYGAKGDFLPGSGSSVSTAPDASPQADWKVDAQGSSFKVSLPAESKARGVDRAGKLTLVDPANAGAFGFARADGCAIFP